MKKVDDKEFVLAIDGEEGFYVYEVDGKCPNATVNEFKLDKDTVVEWKKLTPIPRKKIFIKIK